MKKLLLLSMLFTPVALFAHNNKKFPWDFKSPKNEVAKTASEVVDILYTGAQYYDANYWYLGQGAGYFFVLALLGQQEATWELSVDVQVTLNNTTSYMKTFTFIVPPGNYPDNHTHIMEMGSQLSPGETIEFAPYISINHWWIIS
jgi:hypothetical protein